MSSTTTTVTIPPRGYQDPYETWSAKFVRKFNENPWVPIGCLATCGALVMSAVKLRAGKSQDMNYWLRARVGLQGLTLVALVGGSMAIQKARDAEIAELPSVELSREKEKQEFEERLKEAQFATEQELGFGIAGSRVVKGPTVNKEKRDEERKKHEQASVGVEASGIPGPNATSTAVKSSSSWLWWSKSKGSDSQEVEKA